jgi:hypothetical protein
MSETHLHSPSSGGVFETCRLDLVAYLIVEGFSLHSVSPRVAMVSFFFNDAEGQAEAAQLRFQSGAKVSANTYSDAIRRVRELVFDAKRRYQTQKGHQQNANRNQIDDPATA